MKLNPKSLLIVLKMFELSLVHVWVILHSLNLVKKKKKKKNDVILLSLCTISCFLHPQNEMFSIVY